MTKTRFAGVAVITAFLLLTGCGEQKKPPVTPPPSDENPETERLQAQIQWLRQQLEQEKARADTAEGRVKELEEQLAGGPSSSPRKSSGKVIAQSIVRLGGSFEMTIEGGTITAKREEDIPNDDFPPAVINKIDFTNAPLTDADYGRLAECVGLRCLTLNNVSINARGLQAVGHLPTLEELHLVQTKGVDDALVGLQPAQLLRTLDLSHSDCGDRGLEQVGRYTQLDALDLLFTKISDNGLRHLGSLKKLRSLSLAGTAISGEGLSVVKDLPNLQDLLVFGTPMTDAGLRHLEGRTNLRSLWLGGTRITDAGIGHLVGLDNLTTLHLDATRLTDEGLKQLVSLRNLDWLRLEKTDATGKCLSFFKSNSKLRDLRLDGTTVTDEDLKQLTYFPNLQVLGLADTGVTDKCIRDLAKAHELQTLILRGTKVTDEGVTALKTAIPQCSIER